MSTSAASGEISEGKLTSYEESMKALTQAVNKLSSLWEQGSKAKLEESKKEEDEDEEAKKEEAKVEARRIALRKLAAKRRTLLAELPKSEDEELQRKKLEELKSKISEVKKRVEEAKALRDKAKMEANVKGKASVGAVAEEQPTGAAAVPTIGAGDHPLPKYWPELLGASRKYKDMGFLSSG